MRDSPGLIGTPIMEPTAVPKPCKEPEVITIRDSEPPFPPKVSQPPPPPKESQPSLPPKESQPPPLSSPNKKHPSPTDKGMTKRTHSKPPVVWKETYRSTKADTKILNELPQTATIQKPTRSHDIHKGCTQRKLSLSLTSMSSLLDEDSNGDLRHKITKLQRCNKDCIDTLHQGCMPSNRRRMQ